jgi:hypothetical protein
MLGTETGATVESLDLDSGPSLPISGAGPQRQTAKGWRLVGIGVVAGVTIILILVLWLGI